MQGSRGKWKGERGGRGMRREKGGEKSKGGWKREEGRGRKWTGETSDYLVHLSHASVVYVNIVLFKVVPG